MFLRVWPLRSRWILFRRNFHYSSSRRDSLGLTTIGKLRISEEISHALAHQQPVLALESAIITHGLPRGENLNTAVELEGIARQHGVVPATIAIIDGVIQVGLSDQQLTRISQEKDSVKLSKRDLQTALSLNLTGGTTCAATMFIANMCSIGVFATGGLGGVHRGGESSLDISADITELSRTPMLLVSAGVKSILDIGRTLEYLETHGVNVVTYGPSRDFPAFYVPTSGFQSPWNVSSPEQAARLLSMQEALKPTSGTLLAVPIPAEFASRGEQLQRFVDQAIAESQGLEKKLQGKEVTPWLLDRVRELSGETSVASNKALIMHSVTVASQVAAARWPIAAPDKPLMVTKCSAKAPHPTSSATVVVIGSAALDVSSQPETHSDSMLDAGSTTPGSVLMTFGGVARNIAESAHRILSSTRESHEAVMLIAPIACDAPGELIRSDMTSIGLRRDGLIKITGTGSRSASCVMHLDRKGNLMHGIADMDVTLNLDYPQIHVRLQETSPALVVLDANLNPDTIHQVVKECISRNIETFFEPTSLTKSSSILPTLKSLASPSTPTSHSIDYISPNIAELRELTNRLQVDGLVETSRWQDMVSGFHLDEQFLEDFDEFIASQPFDTSYVEQNDLIPLSINLLPFIRTILVKCGPNGALIVSRDGASNSIPDSSRYTWEKGGLTISIYPPAKVVGPEEVVNVTGAGDSFVGVLAAGISQDPSILRDPRAAKKLVATAQRASVYSLGSPRAVSSKISDLSLQMTD